MSEADRAPLLPPDFPVVSEQDWQNAVSGSGRALEQQVQGLRIAAVNTRYDLPSANPAGQPRSPKPLGLLEVTLSAPRWPAVRPLLRSSEATGWTISQRDLPALLGWLSEEGASIARLSVELDALHPEVDAYLGYLRQQALTAARGGTIYSPSANLVHWQNHPVDVTPIKLLTEATGDLADLFTIAVRGDQFEPWGAAAADELALLLGWWVAYCDQLTDLGLPIESIFARSELTLPTGSDFFADLAKFRALRSLVDKVAQAYGIANEVSRPRLRAVSGLRNKTFYDPDGNLLRNATEALAALAGGVDTLSLRPHDFLSPSAGPFGIRMAINAYQILRHEAHLGKVYDPAAGSYFFENLTGQLVEKSWQQFLDWEEQGGFTKLLQNGTLEAHGRRNLTEQRTDYRTHRRIAVGATRYGNAQEQTPEPLGDSVARGALFFERIRNAIDRQVAQGRSRPAVGVCAQADSPVAKQRRHYVQDGLVCLGLASQEITRAELSKLTEKPPFVAVVFCGTDAYYESTVVDLLQSSPDVTYPRWLAGGSPETIATVRTAGGNGVLGIGHDLVALIEPLINRWMHET